MMIYKYRVLKSSWGIAIDIDIDIVPLEEFEKDKMEEINASIFLGILDNNFDNSLLPFVKKSIGDISELVYSKKGNVPICIVINKIEYNPTDFQKEGLYFAIQDSIYTYLGETPPSRKVEFDKVSNQYIFG